MEKKMEDRSWVFIGVHVGMMQHNKGSLKSCQYIPYDLYSIVVTCIPENFILLK